MTQVLNNQVLLKNMEPNRVIIVSFLIWSGLFIISPLTINIRLDPDAYLFILFSFAFFALGGIIQNRGQKPVKIDIIHVPSAALARGRKTFNYLLIVAGIGLILKLLDRLIFRGISYDIDFEANRELMVASGGNPVGILASFLSPFCYFPLFYFYKYRFGISKFKKFLVYLLFFGQIFDSFLLSSRSAMFINIVFLLLFLLYFRKVKISFRRTFRLASALLLITALMSYIFIGRTKVFAGDNAFELVLYSSNLNFAITSSQAFLHLFESTPVAFQPFLIAFISTLQYFIHGMFEFSYVYEHFRETDHSFGQYTFFTYSRFISMFFEVPMNPNELINLSPRVGVYTTLFGPLYIDFGWLNLIFMFIAGYGIRNVYNKAMLGVNWAILMYFYFFIVLAFWPVFNFINGAGGIFILTSLILLSFFSNSKIRSR
jgi:hypothetical protein